MSIFNEKYNGDRINLLYQLLKSEADGGSPKDYDIKVDGLKVISRTCDPERFHSHEDFVLPETKVITVSIYDGASNRCAKYNLFLKESEDEKQESLSGIEKSIDDKLTQERKKWEYDQLKKDYDLLKLKLDESEEYADSLNEKIEQLETASNTQSNKLVQTLISLGGAYLSSNPGVLNGIPILSGLLGRNNNDTAGSENTTTNSSAEYAAAYETENRVKAFSGAASEKEIEDLEMALIPFFPEADLEGVEDILELLHKNNHYIPHVLSGLQNAVNHKPGEQ